MTHKLSKKLRRGGMYVCPLFLLSVSPVCTACYAGEPADMEAGRNEVGMQRYEAYIDSASHYASRQKWADAERCTLEALKINPAEKSNWLLWANLGELRARQNDTEGAIEAYTIGLSRNPESPKMLTGRAGVLLSEKRYEEALSDIESLLAMDENMEWPRKMRGFIRLGAGDFDGASADFGNIIENHPGSPQGYEGMARVCAARNEWKEAIKYCDLSLEKEDNIDLWYLKISLLAEKEHLSEASEALVEAMRKYPRTGNLFALRAYIHKLSFRNEEMEIDMKLAKEYGADPHIIEFFQQKKTR